MAEAAHLPRFTEVDRPDLVNFDDACAHRFTEATHERHKREGLELAMRARWIGCYGGCQHVDVVSAKILSAAFGKRGT